MNIRSTLIVQLFFFFSILLLVHLYIFTSLRRNSPAHIHRDFSTGLAHGICPEGSQGSICSQEFPICKDMVSLFRLPNGGHGTVCDTVTQHAIPDSGQENPNYPHCWRRLMLLALLNNELAFETIGVAQNMRKFY